MVYEETEKKKNKKTREKKPMLGNIPVATPVQALPQTFVK